MPWQEGPESFTGAPVWRYSENPIIGRNPLKNVVRIFNSAVMPYGDSFIGVFRGGAAPIETSEGWLLFYHGVTGTCNGYVYSIGGAILDIDNPSMVKYRCEDFLLTPEQWYEERGFVPNVCFPCATIHDSASGRIAIYYGAADSYVGLAFTRLDDIMDYIKEHSRITAADTEIGRR